MLLAAGSVDGVTIVVVPTISLRQDLMDRCNRDGVLCAEWNGSRPPYHARIVLVTPESVVSQAFGRFIDEKRTMHQLERIVIDECYTILESTAD
jgi:superfamily II DNA helicase RecQ